MMFAVCSLISRCLQIVIHSTSRRARRSSVNVSQKVRFVAFLTQTIGSAFVCFASADRPRRTQPPSSYFQEEE